MPFEPMNAPFLSGTAAATLVDASGIAPPVIISGDSTATVEWTISGLFVPLLDGNSHFLITVFLERKGPGADLEFPLAPVDVLLNSGTPIVGGLSYSVDIPIADADVTNGAYTVTAVITSTDALGNPATMAGFVELGMRQWS